FDNGAPEYDDDVIREIKETFSVLSASHFSFSVKDMTTADEGPEEDQLEIMNMVFRNNDPEQAGFSDIFDMNKNFSRLNDSIAARGKLIGNDPDGDIEMVFDSASSTELRADYFFMTDSGLTFICVNRNEDAASHHLEYSLAYSEFSWKELRPYLNKNFVKLLNRK
ncbi:MAG TPA: hypothetical protein VL651_15425, partial [Bacteroidia bacterium]|nr:hypothetical protein [Bacteroidia bacterium]